MISGFPPHHLLIIIFFVLEGNYEFFGDVSFSSSLTLFGIFFLLAALIFFICRFFFREMQVASVVSLLFTYVILYCRTIYHYYSKPWGDNTRISNTHFFIVLGIFLFLLVILVYKSSPPGLKKFNRYLNILFLTLILFNAGSILYKYITPANQFSLRLPDQPVLNQPLNGPKPDIYLLLFDEYQGNDGLLNLFRTSDNGPGKMLAQKGFRIPAHPRSNYNYTFYSVPSMMNMSYLSFSDGKLNYDLRRVIKSVAAMSNPGSFTGYLRQQGYSIVNHSFFRLDGIPSPHSLLVVPHDGFTAIYSRTLPGWAQEDLLHFIPSNTIQKFLHTYFYQVYRYNNEVIAGMDQTIHEYKATPKLVYAHLLIPHPPMLTDSVGNLKNISAAMYEKNTLPATLKSSYAAYMSYANRLMDKMVTDIQKQDSSAAIVITSDHGFRSYPGRQDNIFNTQCAVYLPGSNYTGLSDSISLVNLMRLVLNNACGQKIPFISDSMHLAK
jgi:hypothetical protein